MEYKIEKIKDDVNQSKIKLNFVGDFSIEKIEHIKNELTEILADYDELIFDLTNINSVDVTFYQLIIGIVNFCKKENKSLNCIGFESELLKNYTKKIGFESIINT